MLKIYFFLCDGINFQAYMYYIYYPYFQEKGKGLRSINTYLLI